MTKLDEQNETINLQLLGLSLEKFIEEDSESEEKIRGKKNQNGSGIQNSNNKGEERKWK